MADGKLYPLWMSLKNGRSANYAVSNAMEPYAHTDQARTEPILLILNTATLIEAAAFATYTKAVTQ